MRDPAQSRPGTAVIPGVRLTPSNGKHIRQEMEKQLGVSNATKGSPRHRALLLDGTVRALVRIEVIGHSAGGQ